MIPERLAWAGSITMSGVGIYLSYKPVANDLGKGLVIGLATLVIIGAILMFPLRGRDSFPTRLINHVRGRNNRLQSAGDKANQFMADRDIIVNGGRSPGTRKS